MSVKLAEKYSLQWGGIQHMFNLPADLRMDSFFLHILLPGEAAKEG